MNTEQMQLTPDEIACIEKYRKDRMVQCRENNFRTSRLILQLAFKFISILRLTTSTTKTRYNIFIEMDDVRDIRHIGRLFKCVDTLINYTNLLAEVYLDTTDFSVLKKLTKEDIYDTGVIAIEKETTGYSKDDSYAAPEHFSTDNHL